VTKNRDQSPKKTKKAAMKITFYLRDTSDKESAIWIQGYCSDGRIRKSIGKIIPTSAWKDGWVSYKGVHPKDRASVETAEAYMRYIRSTIDNLLLNTRMKDGLIMKSDILAIISGEESVKAEKRDLSKSLFTIIQKMGRGEILTPAGNRYTDNTIKTFMIAYKKIIKYFEGRSLDEITENDITNFKNYCFSRKLSFNSTTLVMNKFKVLINELTKLGEYSGPLSDVKMSQRNRKVQKIFLTEEEIERIHNVDLSHDERLLKYRNLWLTMYYTGLRFSDAEKLKPDNIVGDTIQLMNKKTKKIVVIPIMPKLKELLEKNKGMFVSAIAISNMNITIREICRLAGINEKVTIKKDRAGVIHEITTEKWRLVTSHTARRSITTNMQRNHIPYEIAGDMLGMSRNTWDHYNKMTPQEKASELKKLDFFK
jgi:integrase